MIMEDFQEIKLNIDDVFKDVTGEVKKFPKYTTQLMNIANQNAQGTRPVVVGQLSDLIHQIPKKSYNAWREWYLTNHPDAIQKATNKIKPMIDNFRDVLKKIDEEMIYDWVEDLVITKTAEGLIIQEKVLQYIGAQRNEKWRVATSEEESSNIDGFIGGQPVQIKPITYKSKKSSTREEIDEDIEIIYYKRTNKYLTIYLPPSSIDLFKD